MATLAFWESKKGFRKFNLDSRRLYPCYWRSVSGRWIYAKSCSSVPVVLAPEHLPKHIQLYLMLES